MARKQKKHHYIYKTTCKVNGKYYIGMHSTDNMDDGYLGSGKRLWNSLKKHGKENHSIEILEHYDNREVLKKREEELVTEDLVNDPMCMNLAIGGGGFMCDEYTMECSLKGIQMAKLKLETDEDYKKRFSDSISSGLKRVYANGSLTSHGGGWNRGKTLSDEHKKGIGQTNAIKQQGEKNSQFGTRWSWVSKNGEIKKIPLSDLNQYLDNGWIKGRKV